MSLSVKKYAVFAFARAYLYDSASAESCGPHEHSMQAIIMSRIIRRFISRDYTRLKGKN